MLAAPPPPHPTPAEYVVELYRHQETFMISGKVQREVLIALPRTLLTTLTLASQKLQGLNLVLVYAISL